MMSEPNRPATADDAGRGGLQMLIGAGPARFVADEPLEAGGLDLGPTPHELVASGLAACTAMTLRLYAQRKAWPLGAVHVEVTYEHQAGAQPADLFHRRIRLGGELGAEQRARLLQIAEMCPIHRLLTAGARIVTEAAA
jgi:putative redox protein